ncbi:hypothetical protein Tco_0367830 [Tanacetum coccineum]
MTVHINALVVMRFYKASDRKSAVQCVSGATAPFVGVGRRWECILELCPEQQEELRRAIKPLLMDYENELSSYTHWIGQIDELTADASFTLLIEIVSWKKQSSLLERAHEYYNGMTKDQFKKMQEFIAGRSSKKTASKL